MHINNKSPMKNNKRFDSKNFIMFFLYVQMEVERVKYMLTGSIVIGILLMFLVIGSADGYVYSIAGLDNDSEPIYGEVGDEITIEVVNSDAPINLYIMNSDIWWDYIPPKDTLLSYSIDVRSDNYEMIFGDKNDVYDIEIISCSGNVDLYICDDYYSLFGGEVDIDWSVENVSSGSWTWTQPNSETWYFVVGNADSSDVDVDIQFRKDYSDDFDWSKTNVDSGKFKWTMPNDQSWYLVIENPNEDTVSSEVIIGGGSFLNEGSDACGEVMIGGVLVLGALVAIITVVKKKF